MSRNHRDQARFRAEMHRTRPVPRVRPSTSDDDDLFAEEEERHVRASSPPSRSNPRNTMNNFRLDQKTVMTVILAAVAAYLGWSYLKGDWRAAGRPSYNHSGMEPQDIFGFRDNGRSYAGGGRSLDRGAGGGNYGGRVHQCGPNWEGCPRPPGMR